MSMSINRNKVINYHITTLFLWVMHLTPNRQVLIYAYGRLSMACLLQHRSAIHAHSVYF